MFTSQMAKAVKKMMKLSFGSPAIRAIRFTVGQEETDTFEAKQEALTRDGKPHCTKIDRNLGKFSRVVVGDTMGKGK